MANKDYKRSKAYKEIHQSLVDYLVNNGNSEKFFLDLVNDYMSLWCIKQMLLDDVAEKGVTIRYQNGAHQYGYKRNDSVQECLKTSAQMLKILQQLKIQPNIAKEEIEENKEDDDEL